jgi:Mlc titration factor MtfA (ptsG expression regulator)
VFGWLTDRRRKRILATKFPQAWTHTLERNVAAYALLDATEQKRLRDLVQVFIAEKNWEGCGGLELDDEMRVTIAGTGCLMLLGRDHDLFKEVESILVYPSTVIATDMGRSTFDPGGRVVDEGKAVLGLAVHGGAVVLAWDTALQGARDARDGRNVVIHELAHKIDFIDGSADGTPEFETHAERKAWAASMAPAFLAQKQRAERGKKSLLDDYAITNEAEYFAVASEVFFEKPTSLAKQLPAVYKSLADFYKLDLAARMRDDATNAKKHTNGRKADTSKPKQSASRKSAPAQPFRKTAAMGIVALPAEATPKPSTRAAAQGRKSSSAISVSSGAKVSRGKSSAAIAVPPVDVAKVSRGKSSAAIAVPAVDVAKVSRGRSSAAIAVPPLDVAKVSRGRSSAAIAVPPAELAKPSRSRASR